MTNYHTHTTFCDGADSAATMAAAAFSQGITALGFSAHARHFINNDANRSSILPDSDDWHIDDTDYDNYAAEICRLREEYAGRMEILCGFEADYIPNIASPKDPFYREKGAQYLIGSVHYIVQGSSYFTVDGPAEEVRNGIDTLFNGDAKAAVCEYFSLQRKMLNEGGFEIWAHPDLFRKRNKALHLFDESDTWYREEIKATVHEATKSGAIAEINTGGIARGAIDDVYPSAEFLSLLHEARIPVMINSDAHRAKDITFAFDRAMKAAYSAGYTTFSSLHKG